MSAQELDLPAFLADLGEPVDRSELRALGELHRLLEPRAAQKSALERLSHTVEELPLRYAPFFDKLSEVWDLSEDEVFAVLEGARDPKAWRKPALPGLSLVDVRGGPRCEGADVHLVRFAPGMRFPRHRHPGDELLFVLEGNYRDSSGLVVGPGDSQAMPAGSEHTFVVGRGKPCFAASVQRGREFTGWLIRFLSKFV